MYYETLSVQDWNLIALQQTNNDAKTSQETSVNSLTANFENLCADAVSSSQHLERTPSIVSPRQELVENAALRHVSYEHSTAGLDQETRPNVEVESFEEQGIQLNEPNSDSDSEVNLDDLFSERKLAFLLHDLEEAEEKDDYIRQEQLLQNILTQRVGNSDRTNFIN